MLLDVEEKLKFSLGKTTASQDASTGARIRLLDEDNGIYRGRGALPRPVGVRAEAFNPF